MGELLIICFAKTTYYPNMHSRVSRQPPKETVWGIRIGWSSLNCQSHALHLGILIQRILSSLTAGPAVLDPAEGLLTRAD